MTYHFPKLFAFGTTTSAYQIETCFQHDWENVRSRDGNTFYRTTDHELRIDEDVNIIASLSPHYRMSLMWSKLQREAFAEFDAETVKHYTSLMEQLRSRNVEIMLVLHHFANPTWFQNRGGWENAQNVSAWTDYAKKIIDTFGKYVGSWNTFNEPNVYATMGWLLGEFPPFKKNFFLARKVLRNLAAAHNEIYDYIKSKDQDSQVGISHNCVIAQPQNSLGIIPAKLFDVWFMEYATDLFARADFMGISYYAKICFDPFPITNITSPQKIKRYRKPHDDMWEYYPEGLKESIDRLWKKFGKPIVITENGVCTADDAFRIQSIKDYMKQIKKCIEEGIDIRGYYHWSAWDNFEWTLGPSYKFGLYDCDLESKDRKKKTSADFYSRLAYQHQLELD